MVNIRRSAKAGRCLKYALSRISHAMQEIWPFFKRIPQILGISFSNQVSPTSVQPYPIPISSLSCSLTVPYNPRNISTTHQIDLIHPQLPPLALLHKLSSTSPIFTHASPFFEFIGHGTANHELSCVGAEGEEFQEGVGNCTNGAPHAFAEVEDLCEG